jgi:hypothetical protein
MTNMNKVLNNSLAVLSVLIFILSTMSSAYAMNISESTEIFEESQQNTMTLYRVAPDGSITPIKVVVDEKTEDIGKYLENKCSELFEEDIEMQTLVQTLQDDDANQSNLSFNFGLIRVKSHGKGFHIKTKTDIKITTKFKFFRIMLPRIFISARKGLVVGLYNDSKANTTFYPIIRSNFFPGTAKYVEGNHTVIVRKFFGYTTWTGRFSCLLSEFLLKKDLLPRAFSGVGRLVVCIKS